MRIDTSRNFKQAPKLMVLTLALILGIPLLNFSASLNDADVIKILSQLNENTYRGEFSAKTIWHFNNLWGQDSLRGEIHWNDLQGSRQYILGEGLQQSTYTSKYFGREQWIEEGSGGRVRRIANRQWKKSAFASLLTYEDLNKIPCDFVANANLQKFEIQDSLYSFSFFIKPSQQSLVTYIEMSCQKNPVWIKSLIFYDARKHRLKSIEMNSYGERDKKFYSKGWTVWDASRLLSNRIEIEIEPIK